MIKCYANANANLATFVSKINVESMTDCYCISQNKLTWESTLLLPVWSLEFLLSNAVISPRLLRLLLWDFPTSDLLLLLEGSTGNVVDWLDEWGLDLLGCCLLVRRGGESSWSDFLSPEKYRECSPLVGGSWGGSIILLFQIKRIIFRQGSIFLYTHRHIGAAQYKNKHYCPADLTTAHLVCFSED